MFFILFIKVYFLKIKQSVREMLNANGIPRNKILYSIIIVLLQVHFLSHVSSYLILIVYLLLYKTYILNKSMPYINFFNFFLYIYISIVIINEGEQAYHLPQTKFKIRDEMDWGLQANIKRSPTGHNLDTAFTRSWNHS